MKMFAVLPKKDIAKLRTAERNAREALDDPNIFAERLESNPVFAYLYQNDRRTFELRKS